MCSVKRKEMHLLRAVSGKVQVRAVKLLGLWKSRSRGKARGSIGKRADCATPFLSFVELAACLTRRDGRRVVQKLIDVCFDVSFDKKELRRHVKRALD